MKKYYKAQVKSFYPKKEEDPSQEKTQLETDGREQRKGKQEEANKPDQEGPYIFHVPRDCR